MTQNTRFPFTNRETYKVFTQTAKQKNQEIIDAIRQEKITIKNAQRMNTNHSVSYAGIAILREEVQSAEQLRADAKVEAHRQYVSQMAA